MCVASGMSCWRWVVPRQDILCGLRCQALQPRKNGTCEHLPSMALLVGSARHSIPVPPTSQQGATWPVGMLLLAILGETDAVLCPCRSTSLCRRSGAHRQWTMCYGAGPTRSFPRASGAYTYIWHRTPPTRLTDRQIAWDFPARD